MQNNTDYRLVIWGLRKPLSAADLWLLRQEESTVFNRNHFAPNWKLAIHKWRGEKESSRTVNIQKKKAKEIVIIDNPKEMETKSTIDANEENFSKRSRVSKNLESKKTGPPLIKTLIKVYGIQIFIAHLMMLLYVFAYILNPCLLWY